QVFFGKRRMHEACDEAGLADAEIAEHAELVRVRGHGFAHVMSGLTNAARSLCITAPALPASACTFARPRARSASASQRARAARRRALIESVPGSSFVPIAVHATSVAPAS